MIRCRIHITRVIQYFVRVKDELNSWVDLKSLQWGWVMSRPNQRYDSIYANGVGYGSWNYLNSYPNRWSRLLPKYTLCSITLKIFHKRKMII